MKILFVFLVMFTASANECANKSLKKVGFNFANSKTFLAIEKSVNRFLDENRDGFEIEFESREYSTVLDRYVQVTSLDNIHTDKSEMIGDIVYIRDLSTGKLVEIRWFQYGMKLIAFDRTMQSCPTAVVPELKNRLF